MFGKIIFIHKSPGLVPETWDEAGVSCRSGVVMLVVE